MRIAIMGAGAVGGYFGGLLSLAGHEVTFIARGAHGQALRERGLVLDTPSRPGPRGGAFRGRGAGFTTEPLADTYAVGWAKFVGLAFKTALTHPLKQPAGPMDHDPGVVPLAARTLAGWATAARSEGIGRPADIVTRTHALHHSLPSTGCASMDHNLTKVRLQELDSYCGCVRYHGHARGRPGRS